MPKYSLLFINNSTMEGNVCVYQRDPGQPTNLYSLAWFTHGVRPRGQQTFEWDIKYSFIWSQTGVLKPGITFLAQEVLDTDPSNPSRNSIGFNKNAYGYSFAPSERITPVGMMGIYADDTVVNDEASIGVAMGGSGTFAYNAKTNVNYTFQPHPQYWITFGDYHKGQVMDVNIATATVPVEYPNNVYTMVATLKEDNTWSISQLQSYNSDYLKKNKR